MTRPLNDSPYLYGLHDPGGEQIMLEGGAPGWVLVTVAIGHNPNDNGPGDDARFWANYRPLSDRDLGVIVRLNNAYSPGGTLPFEQEYDNFARRCANFVRISQGCHLWQIGNETNHPIEWPGAEWNWNVAPPRPVSPDKEGEKITPQRYAAAYRKVRNAIKALPGRADDQVLVAAPAPWNNLTNYPENPHGDWVQYLADILRLIGAGNCDGITIHSYTHGDDPALVTSDAKVGDGRFATRFWNFRAYQDFMRAIPESMRRLPVYLTESNQGDNAWADRNSGWVREAYKEIDRWNDSGAQQIRALILYRYPRVGNDRWWIEGKNGVIADFRQSLVARYQWQEQVGPDVAALQARYDSIKSQYDALLPSVQQIDRLAGQANQLASTVTTLNGQAAAAATTRSQINTLDAEVSRLEVEINQLGAGGVAQPAMTDLRGQLPASSSKQYPTRALSSVRRVVVHHTATRSDITPQQVAQFQVTQGLAGIKYHFFINGDGTISWVQPVESIVAQTNVEAVNADGAAVCLAGNFAAVPPGDVQMEAAAQTIAWLLDGLGLTAVAIVGRSEVDASDPSGSPGNQWLADAAYKEPLVARVQAIIDEATPDQDAEIQRLLRRIRELEQQIADLQTQAAQVPALTAEVQALRAEVARLEAQVQDLTAQNTQLRRENARLTELLQNNTGGGGVTQPPMVDLVDSLPKHPTLPPYQNRTARIARVVVHHTDTPPNFTVRQIADYHVNGERRDANGNLVKAQWPGIGYHYVILPDGTINQTQRPETRSYHAGNANNDSIGVSLIGRFMRRNWNGTPIPTDQQLPAPPQLDSTARLIAWLMKEHGITAITKIVGHKEVSDTSCPGDQWLDGANWKQLLHGKIEAIRQVPTRPIELMLMFWQHGDQWAEADWRSAQAYIAHFRPATTFTPSDGFAARHVVIVGGDAGVSGQDEARLRTAGVDVHRLAGANEAQTKAMLDALVAADTPWPGATRAAERPTDQNLPPTDPPAELVEAGPDEWTVPDSYQTEVVRYVREVEPPPPQRVMVDSLAPSRAVTLPNQPAFDEDGLLDSKPPSTDASTLATATASLSTAADVGLEVVA